MRREWTADEAVAKGYTVHHNDSVIAVEYLQHGFSMLWVEHTNGFPYHLLPTWIMCIDRMTHWSPPIPGGINRDVFCGVCAVQFLYNNKNLKEKWSTLVTLLNGARPHLEEIYGDLEAAGFKVQGCVLRKAK